MSKKTLLFQDFNFWVFPQINKEGKRVERRLESIFVNAVKAFRFWFWHEAVNGGYELMAVDYIHFRQTYIEITLLGNLPTFFYFGITLLPLKKKILQTSRQNKKLFFAVQESNYLPFFFFIIIVPRQKVPNKKDIEEKEQKV